MQGSLARLWGHGKCGGAVLGMENPADPRGVLWACSGVGLHPRGKKMLAPLLLFWD